MDFPVSPNAILTPKDIRRRVKRANGEEEELVVAVANISTAVFESLTRRRLRERVYTSPFTAFCQTSLSDTDVRCGDGFPRTLHPGEDVAGDELSVAGNAIAAGTRVVKMDGVNDVIVDTKPVLAVEQTLTFGSEPLYVDSDGSQEILLPESPVAEVFSVKVRDREGNKTDVDLTGSFLDNEAGILKIPNGRLPRWILDVDISRSVEIECRAGYRSPRAGTLVSDSWYELSNICLGIAEVLFRDYKEVLGRATEATLGPQKLTVPDVELPKRLEMAVRRFEREVDLA